MRRNIRGTEPDDIYVVTAPEFVIHDISDESWFEKNKEYFEHNFSQFLENEEFDLKDRYNLACCYHFGYGVGKNDFAACNLLTRISDEANKSFFTESEKGELRNLSSFALGYILKYHFTRDELEDDFPIDDTTRTAFDRAMKAGNIQAIYEMAECYRETQDPKTRTNIRRAFLLYQDALHEGYTLAADRLAECYLNGNGVPKNQKEASMLCEFSRYFNKEGSTKINSYDSLIKAVRSCRYKADEGDIEAILAIAYCYRNGVGFERNPEVSFEYYQRAFHKGYFYAAKYMADCYREGDGTIKSLEKASILDEFCEKYDELGIRGVLSLARGYFRGVSVEGNSITKNPTRGFEIFKLAADMGNSEAMHEVGNCYYEGNGVEKSELLGAYFLSKAYANDRRFNEIIATNTVGVHRIKVSSRPLPKEKCLDSKQIIEIIRNLRGVRVDRDSSSFISDITSASQNNLTIKEMTTIKEELQATLGVEAPGNSSVRGILELIKSRVKLEGSDVVGSSPGHIAPTPKSSGGSRAGAGGSPDAPRYGRLPDIGAERGAEVLGVGAGVATSYKRDSRLRRLGGDLSASLLGGGEEAEAPKLPGSNVGNPSKAATRLDGSFHRIP